MSSPSTSARATSRWKVERATSAKRAAPANQRADGLHNAAADRSGRQTQLISAGSDQVSAYDPATGKERWWANYDGYSNVSQPVFANGMIFICSGYDSPIFYGIRTGGTGDSHAIACRLDTQEGRAARSVAVAGRRRALHRQFVRHRDLP